MNNHHRITCGFIPETDFADVVHDTETDQFYIWVENTRANGVPDITTINSLTRAQMHELHSWLGETLGLTHPAPKSPLTASRAAVGAAKASRNAEPQAPVAPQHRPVEAPQYRPRPRNWDVV